VIYGDSRNDGWWGRDDDNRRARPRAIPRSRYPDRDRYPYPNDRRSPYPYGRGDYGYSSVPYERGYEDGYEKGLEDARDRDDYDPVRHGRYRSGDRGYDRRYGTKEQYKHVYREGFRAGYDEGYRDRGAYRSDRRDRGGWSWPF
jgi:hypothetical protein